MDTSLQILVIIISLTLGVFLVVSIVAMVKVVKLVNVLQRIAEQTENLVEKANSVGEILKKSAGPVAVGRFVTHITNAVLNRDKSNKKKER
ncbi:MAG: hypothetical protein U5K77_04010 [Candidatus Saccharibacteria bacterium]|nr:hypothetical protein [Candidatus Saccharibacteria bacterium]